MSGKFNVFDEWGNKVGEYTPTGGSGADGLIMIIVMIYLWTIGFLIYTFFRLIEQGVKEANLGNWNKAVNYLIWPGITICIIIYGILIAPAIHKQQEYQFEQGAIKEADLLTNNPPITITITDGSCPQEIDCTFLIDKLRVSDLSTVRYLRMTVSSIWRDGVWINSKISKNTQTDVIYYDCISIDKYPLVDSSEYFIPPNTIGSFYCYTNIGNHNFDFSGQVKVCGRYKFEIGDYNRVRHYYLKSGQLVDFCQHFK